MNILRVTVLLVTVLAGSWSCRPDRQPPARTSDPKVAEWEHLRQSIEESPDIAVLTNKRLALLMERLTPDERAAIGDVEVRIAGPKPEFGVRIVPLDPPSPARWRIVISPETYRYLHNFGMAMEFGGRWYYLYAIYFRSVPPDQPATDPLRISGLYPDDLLTSYIVARRGARHALSQLDFLLAHELGHAKFGHLESTPDRELAADLFAMELLHRNDEDAWRAMELFGTYILSMEGGRHPIQPGSHPPDHTRARRVGDFIVANIDQSPWTADERVRALEAVEQSRKLFKGIEDGPFFADLEELAKKFDPSRLEAERPRPMPFYSQPAMN